MAWPAWPTSRATAGRRSTLAPHWKKVAGTLWRARISRSWGVLSLGPSSKVRAIARRVGSPRQREGPKIEEERPRTAQAMEETAARAAAVPMGKGSMRVYCSEGGDGKEARLKGAGVPAYLYFPDRRLAGAIAEGHRKRPVRPRFSPGRRLLPRRSRPRPPCNQS